MLLRPSGNITPTLTACDNAVAAIGEPADESALNNVEPRLITIAIKVVFQTCMNSHAQLHRRRTGLKIVKPAPIGTKYAQTTAMRGVTAVSPGQKFYILLTNVMKNSILAPKHMKIPSSVELGNIIVTTTINLFVCDITTRTDDVGWGLTHERRVIAAVK